ncbi:MAG: hypothetical protein BWY03_00030 [Parcubacteria group bacterium ADurb.Bin159]|nr:MAG: hypothetical protein BWY03_00030 [Parcubacteria group bacterium ADurb.Bin159]
MFESKPKKQEQFDQTPDVSQKDLLKEVKEEKIEEEIYVMPETFRKAMAKKGGPSIKKGLSPWAILLIAVFVLLVIGGGLYWWVETNYLTPKVIPSPSPLVQENLIEEPIESPEETTEVVVSSPLDLKATIKDQNQEIISSLELSIPEGAYEPTLEPSFNLEELPFTEIYNKGDYQVIVGPYKISPADIPFNKPIKITAYYKENIISSQLEEKLALAYFKDNFWSVLPATLDKENNLLIVETDILPGEIYAIVCHKSNIATEEVNTKPIIKKSLDSDNDGLTDMEEILFNTGINDPDTDKDGISDGQEIINLTDPTKGDEAKLATSSLIKVYSNLTHHWAIFYPSSWSLKTIPETEEREILIIPDAGTVERFSLTVEDNLSMLSPLQWYLSAAPGVFENELLKTIINGKEAVFSPDRLTLYLSNENKIIIFSYSLGTLEEANFRTAFEMMINSFQFITEKPAEELSPETPSSEIL